MTLAQNHHERKHFVTSLQENNFIKFVMPKGIEKLRNKIKIQNLTL
jgi:hypothetical protein